jgi:hypothetical protein
MSGYRPFSIRPAISVSDPDRRSHRRVEYAGRDTTAPEARTLADDWIAQPDRS